MITQYTIEILDSTGVVDGYICYGMDETAELIQSLPGLLIVS